MSKIKVSLNGFGVKKLAVVVNTKNILVINFFGIAIVIKK